MKTTKLFKDILSHFDEDDIVEVVVSLDGLKIVVGLKTFDCVTNECNLHIEIVPKDSLDEGLLELLTYVKNPKQLKGVNMR